MSIDLQAGGPVSRRRLMSGGLALGGFMLVGCSPSGDPKSSRSDNISAGQAPAAVQNVVMTVYRDPSCGCCEAWARIARQTGYDVTLVDDPNMAAVKQRLGVPPQLASCHTAVVDGLVIEGHVPLDQVDRLRLERPADIKGIAVPGMPIGSPGMEVPDGSKQPFQVIAFDQAGRTAIYST